MIATTGPTVRAERRLAPTFLGLVAVLALWLAPMRARADVSDIEHDSLATNGAVTIAWCADASIWVGEWDPFAHGWMSKTKVRAEERCDVSLRLARSGDATILAVGDLVHGSDDSHAVEIVRLERASNGLRETAATKLASGFAASIVASADAIVVASFEELPRTPDARFVEKPAFGFQKMHVRALDPRTLAVVCGRTIYGHGGLRPHQVAAISGRALAMVGGTLFVGVPDDKPRMATFELPTLRPTGERVLSTHTGSRSSWFTSVVLVRNGATVGAGLDPPAPTAAVKEAIATLP